MLARRALPTLSFGLVATVAVAVVAATGACSQEAAPMLSGGQAGGGSNGAGNGSGGDQGAGGGKVADNAGREAFDAFEPEMYTACGSCHDATGISNKPFLQSPDFYNAITSWPQLVVADPSQSLLLTYPFKGSQHTGTDLDSPTLKNSLLPKIKAWLDIEAKALNQAKEPTDAGKLIPPFAPVIGFNAVYLDALGDAYKGMAITFTASELDSTTLELSDLEVHPTAKKGLHLVHPLFVVVADGSADPDPVDSFSNVDQEFPANQTGTLGPGTGILTNWVKDGRLDVAFETIALLADMSDAGTTTGCKDADKFGTDAQPDLKKNCFSCHGGANPTANGALDMSKLDSDPAAACAQVLNWVKPATPAQSQVFLNTDPNGSAVHPFKFNGNAGQFNAFKTDLTKWIQAED